MTENIAPARSLDDLRAELAFTRAEWDRWTNRVADLETVISDAEADEQAVQAVQADEVDLDAALVETLSAMQRAKLDAVRDMLVRKADEARAVCTLADQQGLTAIRARARVRYAAYSTALAEFDRAAYSTALAEFDRAAYSTALAEFDRLTR